REWPFGRPDLLAIPGWWTDVRTIRLDPARRVRPWPGGSAVRPPRDGRSRDALPGPDLVPSPGHRDQPRRGSVVDGAGDRPGGLERVPGGGSRRRCRRRRVRRVGVDRPTAVPG